MQYPVYRRLVNSVHREGISRTAKRYGVSLSWATEGYKYRIQSGPDEGADATVPNGKVYVEIWPYGKKIDMKKFWAEAGISEGE